MSSATLNLAIVCVTGAIAAWRGIVLVRDPQPTRGRIVVFVLFASAFVSNLLTVDMAGTAVEGLAPGLTGLGRSVALLGFFAGFVIFFGSSLEARRFWQVRVQLYIAAAAIAVFLLGWLLNLPSGRPLEYRDLIGPASSAGNVLFFLNAHIYFAYACAASAWLAGYAAARAGHALGRAAFALCSAGMVLALVGGPGKRLPETVLLALGGEPFPAVIGRAAPMVLSVGIVVVVIGLSIVALRTAVTNANLWLRARRGIRDLDPLWRELCAAFPAIALAPPDVARGHHRRVRGVPLQYRRRLVECRDGLWRLSPYVEDPDETDTPAGAGPLPLEAQADLVARALKYVQAGGEPVAEPVAIAAAPTSGDDDGPLVALAQAFSRRIVDGEAPQSSSKLRA